MFARILNTVIAVVAMSAIAITFAQGLSGGYLTQSPNYTAYNSSNSRRGLGFDKPEKDNKSLKEPYPSASVSPRTFGHTGFTGTCVWADPEHQLLYIFLSNRVYPTRDNKAFSSLNLRPKIQEVIYSALL